MNSLLVFLCLTSLFPSSFLRIFYLIPCTWSSRVNFWENQSYLCVLGTFFSDYCVQIPDEKNLTGERNSFGSQFEWTQFIMAELAWEQEALWWQELAHGLPCLASP